ncbi:MAG: Tat pathway signal protein [Pseudomonadota bacterium]
MNRRQFLATTAAAATIRAVPTLTRGSARRVVTLVYDKALGAMRLIDKAVP